MRCRAARIRMADFSAGALGLGERRRFEAHLHACRHCSDEYASFQAVLRTVESVESSPPPADLWESVLGGIEQNQRDRARGLSRLGATQCSWVEAKLASYSAGALRESQMIRVETHLHGCDGCAEEWRSFQSVMRSIEALEPQSQPPFLWAKVRDRIAPQQAHAAWWQRPKMIPAFAGGMALAALLAFAVVKHERPGQAPASRPMVSATSNLDFIQQHAAMAQNELFSDKTALGTLVNYVPADRR